MHENVGCEARSLVTNAVKGRKRERRCLQEFSSNRQQTRQLHFIQRGLTLRRQKWNSIGAGTSVLSVLRGAGATYNVYDAVQAAQGRQREREREPAVVPKKIPPRETFENALALVAR